MANRIIIAENQTAGAIVLEDIGITVPASGSYTLTDTLFVDEIQESNELFAAVNADDILINDGSTTLSKQESLDTLIPAGEEQINQNVTDIGQNTTDITQNTADIAALEVALDGYASAIHAGEHENGGSDEIELSNMGTVETDTTLILQPDGIGGVQWNPSAGMTTPSLSEVLDQGNTTDGYDIVMSDGDEIVGGGANPQVTIEGVKHYPSSAADPTLPAPAAGDRYYNTTLNEEMRYDAGRSKWLSVATENVTAGRNGNTSAGIFYRGVGNLVLNAATRGIPVEQGTITYIGITRTDADAATLDVLVNGAVVGSLAHAAGGLTENTAANIDFASGLMSFQNQAGGNTTSNVQIVVRYKKRV